MIKEATIFVSSFEETKNFYTQLFQGLVTTSSSDEFQLSFLINQLNLKRNHTKEDPFYHFAFLVPYSLFDQAKEFVQSVVPLNTQDGKDEISFKKGIHSCYFYDPSGNIVEFIAMEAVDTDKTTFTVDTIKGLVEMSLVTSDVKETASHLAEAGIFTKPLESIKEDNLNFIFTDHTILLLSPIGRTWVFSEKQATVFPQSITVDDTIIEITENRECILKKR